jgi:four helix bundle protein
MVGGKMKIERFEDIRAWQQARELANLVYDLTEKGNFSRDFKLRDQIQGAAGSVMHNIAEGFDDGSDAEFIHFLKYSRRSASEVQSEIYLALDRKYISAEDFKCVRETATITKKSINAFIAYLRKSKRSLTKPS